MGQRDHPEGRIEREMLLEQWVGSRERQCFSGIASTFYSLWRRSSPDPLEKEMQPTPGLLPGKSHGRRNMIGYSPWGRKESDMTERLHFLSTFYSLRAKKISMERDGVRSLVSILYGAYVP